MGRSIEALKASKQAYYERNKERIKAKVRSYRLNHREAIKTRAVAKKAKHPEVFRKYYKTRYARHRDRILEACRAYHKRERPRILQYMKDLYLRTRSQRLLRQKEYYRKHREERIAYAKAYSLRNTEEIRRKTALRRARNIDEIRRKEKESSRRRYAEGPKKTYMQLYSRQRRPTVRLQLRQKVEKARTLFGNRCALCGYDKNKDVFEFDHLKMKYPSKGKVRHWLERIDGVLREPWRFQMLCANCHTIKTLTAQMQNTLETNEARKHRIARARLVEKFGACCNRCGYNNNPLAFEFDHKDQINGKERSTAVHHVRKYPERFQMLCANCHKIKTLDEISNKTAQRDAAKALQKASGNTIEVLRVGRTMSKA